MNLSTTFAAALLLASSTALYAQAPKGNERPGGGPRFDCSQAKDSKACEERREKMKERHEKMRAAHEKAEQACKGKQGAERSGCMDENMCAQAKDPAKCKARADEGRARFAKAREACKDKAEGQDRRSCMREQMREGKK